MVNLMTNTSDAWAQVVANIGVLLILVGEKHVKAYFKTMHRRSHLALFAVSPIGLVTTLTTAIRLSRVPLLTRLIGRQFEPWAQVLFDVTSVSAGPVGLELLHRNLAPSINPDPYHVASFWIHGAKSGTADELIAWTERIVWFLRKRVDRQNQAPGNSCYDRRAGLATASALRGKGLGAVWIARGKALNCSEEARVAASNPGEASQLKLICQRECTKLDPNLESTSCEGVGLAIAQWTDVSPVLTASENQEGCMFDTLCWTSVLFLIGCNIGIVAAVRLQYEYLNVALLMSWGLLCIGFCSYYIAGFVGLVSEVESADLSCFCGTAAGFVSMQDPHGVQLTSCPNRVIVSEAKEVQGWRFSDSVFRYAWYLMVIFMVTGYIILYLAMREAPWWASLSVLGIAALGSCARSLLDPTNSPKENGTPAIPYLYPGVGGSGQGPCTLNFSDELSLPASVDNMHMGIHGAPTATTICSFPNGAAEPFVFSGTYTVLVPLVFQHEDQLAWGIHDKLMKGFFFRALQLAHGMRVRFIAPLEVSRFGQENGPLSNRTWPVYLYSDVLTPQSVLRQPLEVLVSSVEARATSLMLETILVAVFAVANQAFRLPGCEIGRATLCIGLHDAKDYQGIAEKPLQTISWEGDTWRSYSPLIWVAAKIIYVVMRNESEETMMQMGKNWFGRCEVFSRGDVDRFLHSIKELNLVLKCNDSTDPEV